MLQQHLPFTVLKHTYELMYKAVNELQQHLPFTVLKQVGSQPLHGKSMEVATAPTVYGIETHYSSSDWLHD